MMRKQLTVLSSAFICCALFAQETRQWSLGDCIEYALEQNISIKQQEINVESREVNLQTSQLSRLPSLSANVGENYNFGRTQNRMGVTEDHGAATTSVSANAYIPVFEGFRINNQIKSDKLSLEAASQDLEQARQDISLAITSYFLQVLYAKENEMLARQQLEISKDLVDKTQKMVDGGKVSLSELYDAQSALAQSESRLVDAVNDVKTALLDLAQGMNYPAYRNMAVVMPDVEAMMDHELLMLTPVDSIYCDYLDRRPSVIAAQKRVDQAMADIKVAQSAYWPTINIGASYGSGYYSDQKIAGGGGTFWEQLGQNGSAGVGASLNIPIFNKMGTRNSVKLAKNLARNQQLALDQEKLEVFKEVQQAYVNADAAYGKYLAAEKSVIAAENAFNFEQRKYDTGRSTAYMFNEVRQKLESAKSQMSQAKYNFLLRAKILDFYKGEPLY